MLWLALGPVLLALSLCGNAWAGSVIGAWRIEAAATRILAENDAPAAYKEAEHLQATLPVDATHADRARLLNLLSRIEIYLALTDRAATHAQQAFDLSKQHADRIGQAEADLNIALNAVNQGRLDAMTAAVTNSMVILDGVDRSDLLSEAMLRTAMMYRRQGQVDDSITMAMHTMEIARRSNDPVALAYAHQAMAISFEQSGHLKEAREHYLLMREQARAAHMRRLEAESNVGLGRQVSHLGDMPGGEHIFREGIDIYRKIGNPFSLAFGLFALAENLHGQNRTTASLPVLDEVVAIYEKYPNPIGLWWTLNLRSKYYQSLGRADDARIDAERAYTLAKNIGFPLYLSESAKRLAAIVADRGDYHSAYQLSAEADKMSAQAAVESASAHMLALTKRYESESKQRQIDALKLRNERQTEELQKRVLQQRWLWTTLGGSIIILSGTAIFLLRLRRSHRQLENAHKQLQQFQSHQQAILDAIPDCLFELGLDGRYYDCRALQHDLLVAPVNELLGRTVLDVMPQEAADICLFALREAHEKGTSIGRQFGLLLPKGMCWFELSVARKSMAQGDAPRFIVLSRDITRRKQYDILEKARLDMLDKLSEDAPLAEVLMPLVACVEQLHPDFLSSIMLLDVTGQHLYSIPVPSLSKDYLAAVDGILVGEGVGSCGTAAARGETVIVEDVREHPYWASYKHLALQAGFLACWSQPILDSSGKVLGTFGIYRRAPGAPSVLEMALVRQASHLAAIVIERRQLQDALAQREREFRTLAENSPDNIIRYDLQCRMRYVNPRLEKTLERRAQELLGKTSNEAKSRSDTDYDDYSIKIKTVLMTGQDNEIELTMPDTGEGLRYHHVRFVAERELNGNIVGVLAMGRDVTEYRRLQNALAQREQEFRTLAENSPEMIVRYDRNGRRVYINPAYARQTGIPIDLVWNKTPDEVWKPLMLPEEYMAKLKHVMETGTPEHILLEWHGLDGALVSHQMHAVAEYDEQKNVVGVLVIGHNITELKETERQLEESQHLLRQLAARSEAAREDERKSLAREVHDELGQYLMALRMNVTAIGLKFGKNNPVLQERTTQLTALVDSTIHVVRNVVVSLRPNVLDMGIVPALEWLVDEHQRRTETPCELQVSDEDIYLDDQHATAVFRIVQESLTNIGRHAKASKVDIVLEQRDGQFILQVRDNGQGFDPAVRKDKSFGLVGMQERALMLGGRLEITSVPGSGTVIKLSIPVSNVWSEEE